MKAFHKASVCTENSQKGFGRDLYSWRIFRIYSIFFSQSSLKAPDNSSTWYSCLQHGMREGQASLVAKLLLVTGHASAQTTNRLLQKGCHRYLGSADCAWRALWTSILTPDRKQTWPNPWEQGSHPGGFLTLNALCGCPTIAYSEGLGKERRLWPDVVVYINSGSPTRNQLQISIEGFFLSYTQAFPSYTWYSFRNTRSFYHGSPHKDSG